MTDHGGAASLRTEADIIDKALDDAGCSRARDYMAQAENIVAALHKAGYRVAAQEAPAPEWLRAVTGHDGTIAWDVFAQELEYRLAATPPTPPEGPFDAQVIEGSQGPMWEVVERGADEAICLAAEDSAKRIAAALNRAEARPPEGLDALTDRLAAVLPDALSAMTEGGDETEAPEPSDEPGSPYVMGLAANLAARLSAGGATKPQERAR